jgi:hypothetical protein
MGNSENNAKPIFITLINIYYYIYSSSYWTRMRYCFQGSLSQASFLFSSDENKSFKGRERERKLK